MPTYTISIPGDAPYWCRDLVNQITKDFNSIGMQLCDLGDKFEDLRREVKSDVSEVMEIATSAHTLAVANAAAIESMKRDLFSVQRKCNGLSAKNKCLTDLQESQDTYSRRENLIIRGVVERADETEEMCVASVRQIMTNKLNIDATIVDSMTIVRCHRIGNRD